MLIWSLAVFLAVQVSLAEEKSFTWKIKISGHLNERFELGSHERKEFDLSQGFHCIFAPYTDEKLSANYNLVTSRLVCEQKTKDRKASFAESFSCLNSPLNANTETVTIPQPLVINQEWVDYDAIRKKEQEKRFSGLDKNFPKDFSIPVSPSEQLKWDPINADLKSPGDSTSFKVAPRWNVEGEQPLGISKTTINKTVVEVTGVCTKN